MSQTAPGAGPARETVQDALTSAAAPIIAIDGPAASGKGTVAQGVAEGLRFHYLDSGSLYRLVALIALRENIALNDETRLVSAATGLDVVFGRDGVVLRGADVTREIRSEPVGAAASRVAVLPKVRASLLGRQRSFRRSPGLVAEGRDMGTVVFPDAGLKIYVTASAEARAARRYKQLIEKGNSVTIEGLLHDIRERDARDSSRQAAPLKIAADALVLDTTGMTIDASVAFVLERYRERVKP